MTKAANHGPNPLFLRPVKKAEGGMETVKAAIVPSLYSEFGHISIKIANLTNLDQLESANAEYHLGKH